MSYVPNASTITEPLASRSVESAALEFRTLKEAVVDQFAAQEAADLALSNRVDAVEEFIGSATASAIPGIVNIVRLSGTGAQTSFTLPNTPTAQLAVSAYIQGVYQNHDTFTLAGDVITFSTAPLAGTDNIEIKFVNPQAETGSVIVILDDAQTLTNKTLNLASNTIIGTKAQFNAACTDADFATLAGTETLTNKTLTGATLTGAALNSYTELVNNAGTGAAFTISLTTGSIQRLTTAGNTDITLPASVAGVSYTLIVTYGGGHNLNWFSTSPIYWGNQQPQPTGKAGRVDIFEFVCDGTNIYGYGAGNLPLTTLGDILVHNGSFSASLLGSTVNAKRFLTQTGTGVVSATPNWGTVEDADLPSTLVGKTLTNPTVTNYTETPFTANTGTAITIALTNGTVQILTLTGSPTITMPTAVAGKSFIIMLKTGAGSFTVTWSTVKWPASVAPTITSTASRQDVFSFFSDGTNWYGSTLGQNYTP